MAQAQAKPSPFVRYIWRALGKTTVTTEIARKRLFGDGSARQYLADLTIEDDRAVFQIIDKEDGKIFQTTETCGNIYQGASKLQLLGLRTVEIPEPPKTSPYIRRRMEETWRQAQAEHRRQVSELRDLELANRITRSDTRTETHLGETPNPPMHTCKSPQKGDPMHKKTIHSVCQETLQKLKQTEYLNEETLAQIFPMDSYPYLVDMETGVNDTDLDKHLVEYNPETTVSFLLLDQDNDNLSIHKICYNTNGKLLWAYQKPAKEAWENGVHYYDMATSYTQHKETYDTLSIMEWDKLPEEQTTKQTESEDKHMAKFQERYQDLAKMMKRLDVDYKAKTVRSGKEIVGELREDWKTRLQKNDNLQVFAYDVEAGDKNFRIFGLEAKNSPGIVVQSAMDGETYKKADLIKAVVEDKLGLEMPKAPEAKEKASGDLSLADVTELDTEEPAVEK